MAKTKGIKAMVKAAMKRKGAGTSKFKIPKGKTGRKDLPANPKTAARRILAGKGVGSHD